MASLLLIKTLRTTLRFRFPNTESQNETLLLSYWKYRKTKAGHCDAKNHKICRQSGWLPKRKKREDEIEPLGIPKFPSKRHQEGNCRGKESSFYAKGNLKEED